MSYRRADGCFFRYCSLSLSFEDDGPPFILSPPQTHGGKSNCGGRWRVEVVRTGMRGAERATAREHRNISRSHEIGRQRPPQFNFPIGSLGLV